MMRPADALPVVYVCREAIDFRKGLHALAVLVESQLKGILLNAALWSDSPHRSVTWWRRIHGRTSDDETIQLDQRPLSSPVSYHLRLNKWTG